MIRVAAFRVVDEATDVVALAHRALRLPLERVLDEGLRSVRVAPSGGRPARRRHGRRHRRYQTEDSPHLPIGRHAIRTASGRVHRFDGLLVGSRLASLTRYVRERYLFEPDTVLCDLAGCSEGLEERLGAALENAVQRDSWEDPEPWKVKSEAGSLPGIRYEVTGTSLAGLTEVHHRGATWLTAGGWGEVEVQARRHLEFGGHRVPIRVRVVTNPDDPGWVAWFDGRRVGLVRGTQELPGRLVEDLRRHGRAVAHKADPLCPLADLTPRFLLRVPGLRERRGLGCGEGHPPPVRADRPVVLLSTGSCLSLQDPDGRPLPLPVIDAPAEAMAVLCRRGGSGVYVPGLTPRHWGDVRTDPDVRWLVGASPLELGA